MKNAKKTKGKIVTAYQLGKGTEMEKKLLEEGAIVHHEDGTYELFSLEAVHGKGESAQPGDYFKVSEADGKYYPYPNAKEWFEENHTHISGDRYEQAVKPVPFWQASDPMCEEIAWLIEHNRMTIDESDPDHYFQAFLWGADLSARKDAAVIFYRIERDENGVIRDIDFNFISNEEFLRSYVIC